MNTDSFFSFKSAAELPDQEDTMEANPLFTALPTLYTKTKTGAIQFWTIESGEGVDETGRSYGMIRTTYGQVGTDSPQTTVDYVSKGKNVGRANETTAIQQAALEAKAKWTKQLKAGYVSTKEAAEADERDALIKGGIDPMLAHHYMDVIYDLRPGHEGRMEYQKSKDAKKIAFPAKGQPKLDGIRCTAVIVNGKATLWSRTRKPITSMTHIQAQLEELFADEGKIVIDGELYNHAYKSDFEKIASAVRKQEWTPEAELVQYHVYDVVLEDEDGNGYTFDERSSFIGNTIGKAKGAWNIIPVETIDLTTEGDVVPNFKAFVNRGYEGMMLRNSKSLYKGDRSYDLQKAKPFQDDEFEIAGFTEGRGKLAGRLGTWVCWLKDKSDTFETSMNGDQDLLIEYLKNGQSYVGKLLTVRYQGYTGANKKPRFPKGHSIRDYE